jgi:hypothetical protein
MILIPKMIQIMFPRQKLVRLLIIKCRLGCKSIPCVDSDSSDVETGDVKAEEPKLTEEEEITRKKCVETPEFSLLSILIA